ncbi:MAG TPA: cytochrome-c oxidase, cbb3-type subunit III, partial [Gammaproteobacteria bacterium]|nr:cytochrome-c oxidase, cbb3-type subunit III [Gammaproteobacteria bacterium]
MQSSHVIYGENCAACHGVGGQPLLEQYYPILADDNWLYGSDIQAIMLSIANGRQG